MLASTKCLLSMAVNDRSIRIGIYRRRDSFCRTFGRTFELLARGTSIWTVGYDARRLLSGSELDVSGSIAFYRLPRVTH
jgi:hypothetical protein